MPITYDIEQDYLYKQGIEQGAKAERLKAEEEKLSMIKAMLLLKAFSIEQIAEIMNVSIERIKEIEKELEE